MAHSVSTFLSPFAPPELPGFNATMGPLTPAKATRSLRLPSQGRSPCFTHPNFGTFRLQPPECPHGRFQPQHLRHGPPVLNGLWASPPVRRLASHSGRIKFAIAADGPFSSCCSPARLAATRLLSDTGKYGFARQGLAPCCSDALAGARARTLRFACCCFYDRQWSRLRRCP